jgi:hypothetical protein
MAYHYKKRHHSSYTDMAHEFESPPALDALLTRLGELEVVLGAQTAPRLAAVRALLQRAIALRADGDPPGAAAAIRRAMEELATLVASVDLQEGVLMRAVVERFGAALGRGEPGEMERTADVMRERSGATKVEKKS